MSSKVFYSFFLISFLMAIMISMYLVGGRANTLVYDLIEQSEQVKSKLSASNLQQFLSARSILVQDLSSKSVITGSVLGFEQSIANLEDALSEYKILGVSEPIFLYDILGDEIYSNTDDYSGVNFESEPWFEEVHSENSSVVISLFRGESETYFVITVPVLYNGKAEGVLVVMITQDLGPLFSETLDEGYRAVQLSGKHLHYSTVSSRENYEFIESFFVANTDLSLRTLVDKRVLERKKWHFMEAIAIAIFISLVVSFTLLVFVGRHIVLNPYRRLEKSQRETEVALEEMNILVQAIEVSPVGISIADAQDPRRPLTFVNQSFVKMTGYTKQEVIGRSCSLLQGEKTNRDTVSQIRNALNLEEHIDVEIINYRKDGSEFWNQLHLSPVYQSDGVISNYVGMQQDISVRKNGELVQKLSNVAIEKALESLREQKLALDHHAMVSITTLGGEINFVNQKLIDTSGYSEEELIGEDHRMLKSNVHDDQFFRDMYSCISEGKIWHGEICNKKKNGDLYWLDTTIVAFKDERGVPQSYIAIRTDITELKEARDQAQIAAEAKSNFLANMSHEIRTPMNGILGMLNLITRSTLTRDQQQRIEVAQHCTKSLLALLNDILDFSKIEAGRLDLEHIEFDVRQLLSECVASMAHLVTEDKNVELILNVVDLEDPFIVGDPNRIRQILTNLIGNAIKFTEEGYVYLSAFLEKSSNFQWNLRCSIYDTGIGIPKNKMNVLFGDFNQVDESTTRKYGGTGLGLSITKKLCSLMGGNVTVASDFGVGSCFEFYVNVEKSNVSVETVDVTDISGSAILILCNLQKTNEILKAQLERWGATIYTSIDEVAQEKERVYLEYVFVDFDIVDMECYDLEMFHEDNDSYKDSKWIAMTSVGRRFRGEKLKSIDFYNDVTKPLTPQSLQYAFKPKVLGDTSEILAPTDVEEKPELRLFDAEAYVLLVEDNQVNQLVAIEVLEGFYLKVDCASHGKNALEKLNGRQEAPYSLILMDCQMPEMDGYVATQAIRAGEAGEAYLNTPIIAMTAHAMQGDREKCLAAGMNDYITKPIDEALLQTTLATWLKRESTVLAKPKIKSNASDIDSRESRESRDQTQLEAEVVNLASPDLGGMDLIWDRERVLKRVRNKEKTLRLIVQSYLGEAEKHLNAVESSLEQLDFEALAQASHAIKGVVANLGGSKLQSIAQKMEATSKAQNNTGVQDIFPEFIDAYAEFNAVLQDFVKEKP